MAASALPVLPETAPFGSDQIALLNRVMADTTPEQRSWLSGFLAGVQSAAGTQAAAATSASPRRPLTILYATESGNAESVADEARKRAAKNGFAAKLVDMADTSPEEIAKADNLLVIASTWGEGDPPERATTFYQALMADDAPSFAGRRFAVLALGDSSYVNFCETGRRIDERLASLGAERVADRIDCDLDFEESSESWIDGAVGRLDELTRDAGTRGDVIHVDFHGAAAAYSKRNPFPAEITGHVNLNGSRSGKETIHLELSLAGSGLAYEPGDAIGFVPRNDPAMVEAVLRAAALDGDAAHEGATVAEALAGLYDITTLTRPVIAALAEATGEKRLADLAADPADYIEGRQIVDLLEAFPQTLAPDHLPTVFRKLPPRLYSVASSQKAHPDEAHLLVGVVRYASHSRDRTGVASGMVAERPKTGQTLPVYVKPNKYFRLPADSDRPVIMVGPGTGVAPFRGFLQERRATGAKGRNWLVFGDRTYTHDFLYQLDWQEFRKDGVLDRIDVAFSRDRPEKVYVQDRLWEQRAALFAWLEEGAHLYVCGDEKRMAKDVDAMLHRVVAEAGGMAEERAAAYVAALKQAGRYQRDVY